METTILRNTVDGTEAEIHLEQRQEPDAEASAAIEAEATPVATTDQKTERQFTLIETPTTELLRTLHKKRVELRQANDDLESAKERVKSLTRDGERIVMLLADRGSGVSQTELNLNDSTDTPAQLVDQVLGEKTGDESNGEFFLVPQYEGSAYCACGAAVADGPGEAHDVTHRDWIRDQGGEVGERIAASAGTE